MSDPRMSDPLKPIVQSEQQKEFSELREQFREDNLQRVRRMCRALDVAIKDTDGNVIRRVPTMFMTDAPAGRDHRRVDEWLKEGERAVNLEEMAELQESQHSGCEFTVIEGKGLDKELKDLMRDANALAQHEKVRYKQPDDDPDNEDWTDYEFDPDE